MVSEKLSDFELMLQNASKDKAKAKDKLAATKREKEQREREKLRKQQETERKQREIDAKMRQRHFEAQKKEEEAKRKKEAQDKAFEAARLRREQEARDVLIHGPPKKAKTSGPSFPSGSAPKRARLNDDDDDRAPGGNFLTREEKRAEKQKGYFRETPNYRKTTPGRGYGKTGRELPGGAVNMPAGASTSAAGGGSIKERIKQAPNGLIKLNTVKRDKRTIDEIQADLHATRTLNGDQAKSFDDWWGASKKKAPSKSATPPIKEPSSQRSTPVPPVRKSAPAPSRSSSSSASTQRPAPRPAAKEKSRPAPNASKKRPRSDTPDYLDDDEEDEDEGDYERGPPGDKVRALVWEAMRFRQRNHGIPVFSDDEEDMDADGLDVLEEEERSTALGKKEDRLELARERKREEEKRNRKAKAR